MITGHGARSITGVEVGLDINSVTEKQLKPFRESAKRQHGTSFLLEQN